MAATKVMKAMKLVQQVRNCELHLLGAFVGLAITMVATVATAQHPLPPVGTSAPLPAPRNTGPAAMAHTRTFYHRRKTVRVIRRTPAVMREDAARVSRGELFSTWSNKYLQ